MRLWLVIGVAATAVSLAFATSAEAHEFVASKAGTLKSSGAGKESFTLGKNKVVCGETKLSGKVEATKETEQKISIKVGKCEGFGTNKVTVSETEYDFEAEEGATDIGSDTVITDGETGCTVTLAGVANESTMAYSGTTTVTDKTKASEVFYEASGGVCGTADKVETNGTFEAEATAELEGGEIKWK